MTPDDPFKRWPDLDRLFDQALDAAPEARADFLDRACGADADLRRELERLLEALDADDTFLEDPGKWLAGLDDALTPAPTLEGGRVVGHYEVESLLGTGGMGVVYRARDTRLNRTVALKFLQPHLVAEPEARARFMHEARAASALDHPNICTVYEIDETTDGQVFIAMAFYAGETLRSRIGRGALPVDEAVRVAGRIADALARAHEAGIVHRDLKPANVMLTDHGDVKLLDFGIAKLEGGAEITRTGARLGTVAYMSPEQAGGQAVDHRTDIWSLGVLLAEMLGGTRPFAGTSEADLIAAIERADPALPPTIPQPVAGIIRAALTRAPTRRIQTMVAFRDALEALTAGHTPPAFPAAPARGWRRPATLGIGLLAAIALGVFALRYGGTSSINRADSPPRLAVLPFENLGPPEDEYFADGITDEIVARLAQVRGLAVLARQTAMQYKGTDKSPREIGRELGVEYLLLATVSWQRTGSGPAQVRVRPSLIRVADGIPLWTEAYEDALTEVFAVQTRIAEQVVDALDVTLVEPDRQALARRSTTNLEAYDLYLRGNHFLLQRDLGSTLQAIDAYRAAVDLDPDFADARAREAYAYGLIADHGWVHPSLSPDSMLTVGFEAADRALELNPRSTDAWMARAYLLVFRHPDTYEGVAEAFEQAVTYDPNNVEGQLQYASMIGRLDLTPEVEARLHRVLTLEPGHAIALINLGFFYHAEGRFPEALRYMDSAVVVNPTLYHSYEHRAQVRSHAGLHAGARADAEAAILGSDSALGITALALATARAGEDSLARFAVDRALSGDRPIHNEGRMWLIGALVALGDVDQALDRLAVERRRLGMVYLRHLTRMPDFDPVRADPRFLQIVAGAPPAPASH